MVRFKFLLILAIIYCLSVAIIDYFHYASLKNTYSDHQDWNAAMHAYQHGYSCMCGRSSMYRYWESFKTHLIIGLMCVCAYFPIQIMSQTPKDDPFPTLPPT